MENHIVGPVLKKVIDRLSEFKWRTGSKKELERLREIHPMITAVVSAATGAEIMSKDRAFDEWIWQLRDAIDEAIDLLDDLESMKRKKQGVWWNLVKVVKCALRIEPCLKRLEKVVQKLDNISAEVSTFFYFLKDINLEQREQRIEWDDIRETGSVPGDDLIGRGEDKKSIIEWLRKPSDVTTNALHSNISVLSIVGDGGIGKTTLVQHVYADEMTKEFDLKMWVCVSDIFDVMKVIKDILECIQKKRPTLETLHELQETLLSEVKSKRFLLVLDDIWDDEEGVLLSDKWRNVLSPLAYGGLGSKILITTRADSAASMIAKMIRKEKEVIKLEGLKEDECLQLLNTHAFDVGENPDDYKNLKPIAGELVKKLHGSPLAAKVMGGVLNSNLDERHWRNVLNTCLDFDGIFPILKLSYTHLSNNLQNCFSFCSIFPRAHVFDKDDLVRMWIALDFIEPSHNNQGETLEDMGERYFNVLIKKSFLEKVFYGNGSDRGYKIPGLLHEVAQSVSTMECFRFVGEDKSLLRKIPRNVRHLYFQTDNIELVKELESFKNLRTLIISSFNQISVNALDEIFKVNRSIRLLHINDIKLTVIPESIRYLQHLRYLKFSAQNVKLLPRSLSSLYQLQFLTIDRTSAKNLPDDYFPRNMKKLSYLRYLAVGDKIFLGLKEVVSN